MISFDLCSVPSVVINLDRDQEKLEKFNRRFNKLNIFPKRSPAVNGKSLSLRDMINEKLVDASVEYTINNGRSNDSQVPSMGAIGCYLSHVGVWQRLIQDPSTDMYMVYEDDCDVDSKDIPKINQFVNETIQLFPDWHIIYLGNIDMFLSNLLSHHQQVDSLRQKVNGMVFGTHSYLINKTGAQKLLTYAFPIVFQIDSYMSFQFMTNQVNAYRPYKQNFTSQLSHSSTIQMDGFNLRSMMSCLPNTVLWIFIVIFAVCFLFTLYYTARKFIFS